MEDFSKKKFIKNTDIVMEENPVLRELSKEVKLPLSKEDKHLLKLLYNHVSASQDPQYCIDHDIRSAVGIAAVQVGQLKQLLAVKTQDNDGKTVKYALANPKILEASDQIIYLPGGEGCLSIEEGKYPGIVPRHQKIVVEAYNLFTNKIEKIEAEDFVAIVLQHEIDHLNGKLFSDHINKLDPQYKNDSWISL